jgi:hypothetical protein
MVKYGNADYSPIKTKYMRPMQKKSFLVTAVAALIGFALVSFKAPGGDKFEIYLNKTLVMEHYIHSSSANMKYLTLHPGNYTNTIEVYYSHCGQTGTKRSIVLKDLKNKTLKKWDFADAGSGSRNMTWKVKEIMDLLKGDNSTLKLYYTSKELPEGRMLATVVTGKTSYTSLQ